MRSRSRSSPSPFGHRPRHCRPLEDGATLIELLVGLVIGLLTVVTALGAMNVSRQLAGIVTDASQLQQQASHALRILGTQLRQATPWAMAPQTSAQEAAQLRSAGTILGPTLRGMATPSGAKEFHLSLRTTSVQEPSHLATGTAPKPLHLLRDCLGETGATQAQKALVSHFRWQDGQLFCQGEGKPQPLISGVRDFQLRYLQQRLDHRTQPAQPRFRYAQAEDLQDADWNEVLAVEICLELEGLEAIDSAGAQYTRCDGTVAQRENRLQQVIRSTYHLRNPMAGGSG